MWTSWWKNGKFFESNFATLNLWETKILCETFAVFLM